VKISLYKPQQRALMTRATEVLYGGALGGGKSYLARAASIIYSIEIPGLITYLFRRTFKEVLSNHIYTPGGYLEMLKDLLESGDVTWNKSDNAFQWWNGSRIQLAHSQYETDIFTYQGAQIGFLIVDEASGFSPDMIRFIRTRLRLGSMVVPEKWKAMFPRALYTANPGGIGHNFFKSGWVDFGHGRVFKAPEDEGGMLREYVPAKLRDNVIMLRNDPEYAERVKGMGSAELVQAMIEGDWSKVDGGMFSDVWNPLHHCIEPFDIPYTWNIHRGYDYGSSNPAAVCWFAESDGMEHESSDGGVIWFPKGEIIQIGELYFADKKHHGLRLEPREQARRIKKYEIDEKIAGRVLAGPADNMIFHKEPGHQSIADEMAKEHITFIRGDKTPGSRVIGCSVMRQRLKNATTKSKELPGFRVFNNCVHTVRSVPNLERDDKNLEDVNTSQEDHIWDVIRYRLLHSNAEVKEIEIFGT
jgi:hypothetical protein